MFYVKEEINGVLERIEIHDENVYCECPYCMKEQLVDISEIISTSGDLCGTSVICSECSKVLKEIKNNVRQIVTNIIGSKYTTAELEKALEALVLEYWNEVLYRDEAGEIDEIQDGSSNSGI